MKKLISKFKGGNSFSLKTDGPLDRKELAMRLQWTESNNNPKAKSGAGAVGLFGIMSNVLSDYNKANKTSYTMKDMENGQLNRLVRDWYMNDLAKSTVINKDMSSDSVAYAKQLAAFNWGRGNLSNYLVKLKNNGVDIYDSWDWVNGLPSEPRNYINFILRGLDTGGNRTKAAYMKSKNK